VKSDLQLGSIRDSYYEAKYGPIEKRMRG
jgi:hypothetical protein